MKVWILLPEGYETSIISHGFACWVRGMEVGVGAAELPGVRGDVDPDDGMAGEIGGW
jgi:hypothetical protein